MLPHRRDKALPIAAGGHLPRIEIQFFKGFAAGTTDFVLTVTRDDAAILEVILIADLPLVVGVIHIAHGEQHHLAVGILGHPKHRVGRRALVIPLKASPDRHGPDRVGLVVVDGPASDIELVRPLIVQVAVARLPKPVPVVVHKVAMILLNHGRPLPEVPVEVRRRILRRLHADAVAKLAAIAVGYFEPRQLARLERLVQASDAGIAPLLRAVLDHHAVFFLGLDGHPALRHIVAERLLHVDMLAGLGSPDRHQGVPVIRSRDRNRVDRRVIKDTAEVSHPHRHRLSRALLFESGQTTGQHVAVGIDYESDFHIRDAHPTLQMCLTTAVAAHDGDSHASVGPLHGARCPRAQQQERSCRRPA